MVAKLLGENKRESLFFYGVGEHNTKILCFFFRNLDTVLSDLTQKISPTFDKLNEIK